MKEQINEPQQDSMEQAIRNWELYWVKKPMNEIRTRERLPLITTATLHYERTLEEGKVAEIARAQREGW